MTTAHGLLAPPSGPPPAPPVPRPGVAAAIAVAVALSVAFAMGQVLYWAQPAIASPLPWMRVFLLPESTPFTLTRRLLHVGWVIAAVLGLLLLITYRRTPRTGPGGGGGGRSLRACQFGILGALLLPYAVMPLDILASAPLVLLMCLPTTALALLCVHRVQLYRRLPAWLLLTGFGWGVLIGGGFGTVMIVWFQRYAGGYLLDWEHPRDAIRSLYTLLSLNAGTFSEMGKAAGVAILYLLFRRHFDGVVSGAVVGAAVGLGFNLTETVRFMAEIDPGQATTQFWMRQVIGLMAVHVAFTAVVGAGFGAARGLSARKDRLLVVGGGVTAAIGGHFVTDATMPRLAAWTENLFSHNQTLDLLLGVPLVTAVTSGPFVLAYVVILRRGLREQAVGLAEALREEAAAGTGAVTQPEAEVLLAPRRRLRLELRVWRRDGVAGLRHLSRLHQAQLDLATQHWHRTSPGADPFVSHEAPLRARVRELKGLAVPAARPSSSSEQEILS
ncbi:PrsW family glutamic-type intramembrane protease [Streptomyces lateritius]|uniref:PrsW family glutamic-type intramembrane protease n=1 Tax=Streptomyces lateritius TaxID=67313 RepID=A0ABW6YN51_9ACTN